MPRKRIFIETQTFGQLPAFLSKEEYPNLYLDTKVTDSDLTFAERILATFLMQEGRTEFVFDLDWKEKELAPPVKMSISEIEKELGYKIEIVKE